MDWYGKITFLHLVQGGCQGEGQAVEGVERGGGLHFHWLYPRSLS